ncbi:MAG: AEC family transporter [Clostridiaceae bacterium]
MSYFIFILTNIILPIFIQILLGFALKKFINFSISTLVHMQFYLFTPALLFVKMYNSEVNKDIFFQLAIQTTILFALLYSISFIIGKISKRSVGEQSAFTNSVCLYNSGNFCIPLIELLYHNPFAQSVQIIIMMVQSIITNTVGIYCATAGNKSAKEGMLEMLKVPMIYTIVIALLLREFNVPVAPPITSALESIGNGMVPLALITLGAQLSETKYSFKVPKVYISNFIRLILSPLLAYGLVLIFGLKGVAAEVAVLASSAPTAVNSMLLAIRYDNEQEFASQAVFLSTVFCPITVSAVVYLVFGRL